MASVTTFAASYCTDSNYQWNQKIRYVTPIVKSLKWLQVRDQLCYRRAIMSFKGMSDCARSYLTKQFIKRSDVSKRFTRTSQDLNIPLFRSGSGQRTFYYQTVNLWNSLKLWTELKLCKSISAFKRSLKSKLLYYFHCIILNYY